MSGPALHVQGLVKRYGGIVAVDHVDLEVGHNEIHALIGPNGAGKTTLVHQLAGTLQPCAGTINFHGEDVTRVPMHQRVRSGLARSYQITSVFGPYTVLHNVLLAVLARQGSGFRFFGSPFHDTALIEDAQKIISTVGLAGREGCAVAALSHGERRRVELALALATQPRMLLLDEPMAGMAASDTEAMVELIHGLKASVSVVLVEHDMDTVFRLADRITVLVYGRVIASDAPEAIRRSPLVRQAYLGEEVGA